MYHISLYSMRERQSIKSVYTWIARFSCKSSLCQQFFKILQFSSSSWPSTAYFPFEHFHQPCSILFLRDSKYKLIQGTRNSILVNYRLIISKNVHRHNLLLRCIFFSFFSATCCGLCNLLGQFFRCIVKNVRLQLHIKLPTDQSLYHIPFKAF